MNFSSSITHLSQVTNVKSLFISELIKTKKSFGTRPTIMCKYIYIYIYMCVLFKFYSFCHENQKKKEYPPTMYVPTFI